MNKHIVVDTLSNFAIGTILEQVNVGKAQMLEATVLPYDDSAEEMTGSACWTRRDFGEGRKVDTHAARIHCPTTIFLRPEAVKLHFAVAFAPERSQMALAATNGSSGFPGRLVLAAAPTSSNGNIAKLSPITRPIETQELGAYVQGKDWIVTGESRLSVPTAGYYELGLYGSAQGVLVKWLALSTAM